MSVLRRVGYTGALLASLATLLLGGACDKKGAAPGGMPPLTDSERAALLNGAAAEHPPTGQNAPAADPNAGALPPGHPALPADHPMVGGAGMPAGDVTPGGTFDPNKVLAGELVLDAKVKAQVQAGDTIFLVARTDDGSERGGPILAVKKLTAGAWPQAFQLDGRDAMQAGTPFEGKLLVTARVDKDGDPITKNAGDVLGVAHVQVPTKGLKLALDTITK